jgi:hypothetical protein
MQTMRPACIARRCATRNGKMSKLGARMKSCGLMVAALLPSIAHGYGAVAIGIPESVARDGFSIGFVWDKPRADIARVEALRACVDLKTVPLEARGYCKVVTTFSRQCISIANDPGGSGWGWAVEASASAAQAQALKSCVSTVKKSCVIAASECDKAP